ncbi:MAG: IS21 family transposase [Gammaproteobacteria bacterium]|nr:IS21 family transposase [Gammaproteobacteria bacterium]
MLKLEGLFVIHQLKEQGESIAAIARRTGLDRKTVRKYLRQGLEAPVYGPRAPRPRVIDPFVAYLRERLAQCPQLSAMRLLRELRERGYTGGRTAVSDYISSIRPAKPKGFEHRFETPPGHQAQVDFAQFQVCFTDEPQRVQVVWLFAMVLGWCRYLFGHFVLRQNLETLVRCHLDAFTELGGVPHEVLYDRMKTAVLGESDEGEVRYHPGLLDVAAHFGFRPRACAAYRAKTKGKIERPFRYVREDFFLDTPFANLADLNAQFDHWRATVANVREHGTTRRRIDEAFAEERSALQALPAQPYNTVLRLERKLSRDGMISVDGNYYSVPDTLSRRPVEVHRLATELHIYEAGERVATHPVLEGHGQRRVAPEHRHWPPPGATTRHTALAAMRAPLGLPGEQVAERSLAVYERLGKALAAVSVTDDASRLQP